MFLREKRSVRDGRAYTYFHLAECVRVGGKVQQRLIASLGRADELVDSGKLDRLIQSMSRFSENVRVCSAAQGPAVDGCTDREWGSALVFDPLWQAQGLPAFIKRLAASRRFQFDVERAVFALALQRLCDPGSDRQGSRWLQNVLCPGFDRLQLQHLYRGMRSKSRAALGQGVSP